MAENKDKDKTQQAIADAEAAAAAQKAARDAANAEEAAALQALQAKELEGLQQYNAAQYSNLGQIVGDIQSKIDIAKAKDETAQKRENAYRYISGLGDTLSSLANLVGVANKASNQQQTYNSNAVVQKAEEARKARKIEMDDLSKRADEMQARLRDMKAAGSLNEAQMGVRHQKEQMTLKSQQEERAREAAYKERMLKVDEMNAQSAKIRAEAYEYGQENPKPKATTPKPEHSFELPGGEILDIPNHRWTDTAITSVYDVIPNELKTKRARLVKDAAGRDVEQTDASGNTVYHTPTKQEMLNDIIRAAKVDENVANALRRYAKAATSGANDPEFE